MENEKQTVLLYYQYVAIDDPLSFARQQRTLCKQLGLRGRVIIAEEGINGTLAGTQAATAAYRAWTGQHPLLSTMPFKISHADAVPFARLSVKVRPEIVALGLEEDVSPDMDEASHLTPAQWKAMIEEGDCVLFDVRNAYESAIGRFKGAVAPKIDHFRQLPAALSNYRHLRDKKVLMYCTGGIRCEKASALFMREGFEQVYQLKGGIFDYAAEYGDAHWEGDCFVFDDRMSIPVGESADKEPVGVCAHTGHPARKVTNCRHVDCDRMFVVDEQALAADPALQQCPQCLELGRD